MGEFRMVIANIYSLASGPAATGRIEVGSVAQGDLLTLLGRARQGAVRVTGIQRVGVSVAQVAADDQPVALVLSGVTRDDLQSGDVLVGAARKRVFCDFNGSIDEDVYSLDSVGTRADLERYGLKPEAGLRIELYDYDGLEDGSPAWIVADAEVIECSGGTLAAKTVPKSFRWEPRC